ncbi:sensor domain-containing diguanylate cyclase [Thalassospira sp. MA62]|nr:sensor domain-containing diguanylate cyclase [Thalassospira sp. MA62]
MSSEFTAIPEFDLSELDRKSSETLEQRVDTVLKLGMTQFGLPVGIFSAVNAEKYEVRQVFHPDNVLTPGMAFDLDDTFCSHVISANDVISVHDVSGSGASDDKFGFAAYLGAPVQVDGDCFGTLAFGSLEPVSPFSPHNRDLVRLFADSIGQLICHLRDQQELQKNRRELERQANIDLLTGLYNRHYMEEALRKELERVKRYDNPVVVGLVDFDNFKSINESYGFDAGDAALRMFAKVASDMMRETDIIARWGDKEFLIMMPHTGAAGAITYLQRLTEQVRQNDFHVGKYAVELNLSVGLGIAHDGDTLDTLMARANVAMHESKQATH